MKLIKKIGFSLTFVLFFHSSFATQYAGDDYLNHNELKVGDVLYCAYRETIRAYKSDEKSISCSEEKSEKYKRHLIWESSYHLREKPELKWWEARFLGCNPRIKGIHKNLLHLVDCNNDTHIFNPKDGSLIRSVVSPKSFGFSPQTVRFKNLIICIRQNTVAAGKFDPKYSKCDALPEFDGPKRVWSRDNLFDASPKWLSPTKKDEEQYCFFEKLAIEDGLVAAYNCRQEKFLFEPLTGKILSPVSITRKNSDREK